jgi:muramoyltetrapeptide carboxypeptidase LdcA involved in peptidoglycan recycling
MSPSDAIDENGTLIGEILSHLKNLGDLQKINGINLGKL